MEFVIFLIFGAALFFMGVKVGPMLPKLGAPKAPKVPTLEDEVRAEILPLHQKADIWMPSTGIWAGWIHQRCTCGELLQNRQRSTADYSWQEHQKYAVEGELVRRRLAMNSPDPLKR